MSLLDPKKIILKEFKIEHPPDKPRIKIHNTFSLIEDEKIFLINSNKIVKRAFDNLEEKGKLKEKYSKEQLHSYIRETKSRKNPSIKFIREVSVKCTKEIAKEHQIKAWGRSKPRPILTHINPKLAYLLGALRDGHISGTYIEFIQKSKKWLDMIKNLMEDVFHIKAKRRLLRNYVKDKISSKFLKNLSGFRTGPWETPEIIKKIENPIIKKWYIRGFWDADGGCPKIEKYLDKNKNIPIVVRFDQAWQNKKHCPPLYDIKKILEDFGIKSNLSILCKNEEKRKFPRFRLSMKNYKSIVRFNKYIGSSHPNKGARLNNLSLSLSFLTAA